ncbi:MAG: flippase-like domain-containing protein [Actinobacteria bacterium]|nr:flippase-like domain-containing protein [Actinomycetota bacterium]
MSAMAAGSRRRLFLVGQLVVGVVVGYYIVRTVLDLVRNDAFSSLHFDPWLIIASLALLALYNLMFVHTSQLVLRGSGEPVRFADAFALNYVSALGKYVPGGVWHVVGRFALAESIGVRRRSVVVMTVFENALGVVSGILVAVLGLGLAVSSALGLPVWLAPAVAVASLAALHPALFGRLMRYGLKLAGAEGQMPELSFWRTLAFVAYRAVGWFVAGWAFMLFARAVSVDPAGSIGLYAGAFAAASVFGLLVLFVPGGIGVREAALIALLTPALGAGVAGTVGLTSRVWATAVELALSGIAIALSARMARQRRAEA